MQYKHIIFFRKYSTDLIIIALIIGSIISIVLYNMQEPMSNLFTIKLSKDNIYETKVELVKFGFTEDIDFKIIEKDKILFIVAKESKKNKILSTLADNGFPREKSNEYFTSEYISPIKFGVRYINQREQELEEIISLMRGIEKVSVMVIPQKDSLFESENLPARVNIMLSPINGHSVTKAQIMGIINLVSYSTVRISPENVTIIDTKGVILSTLVDFNYDPYHKLHRSRDIKKESEIARDLTRHSQALLDWGLGKDVSSVEVRCSLNQKGIDRLSVSLSLFEERSPENVEKIKNVVMNSLSLDPERGDTITVTVNPFKEYSLKEFKEDT